MRGFRDRRRPLGRIAGRLYRAEAEGLDYRRGLDRVLLYLGCAPQTPALDQVRSATAAHGGRQDSKSAAARTVLEGPRQENLASRLPRQGIVAANAGLLTIA